jgi:hypothetical protein
MLSALLPSSVELVMAGIPLETFQLTIKGTVLSV